MNDFEYLQAFLQDEPQAAAEQGQSAAGEFLKKPAEGSEGVQVHPGKALPEPTEEPKVENKSIGKHAKESLFPQVRKVADTKERATKVLGAAVPDIGEIPVPSGGIGLLLFISLLMVFAITPINGTSGATRLQLLWGTMLGNYSIGSNKSSGGGKSSKPSHSSGSASSPYGGVSGGMDSLIQGGLYT